jgi:hypothetical protein
VCGRVSCFVVVGGGVVCVGLRGGGGCGWVGCFVVGLGGAGRVGGMRRTSFTHRSSKNYYRRSSTTAASFSKSILTSVWVSFLHITIISSPLSSILVSVLIVLRYTCILFILPSGERCTFALIGDLCVLSALNSARLSYVSGAAITNRCSSGIDILLNLLMSITLLRYPNAKLIVFYQLSCTGFHPCSPPGNSTLLMYIQSFFSFSV